MYNLGESFELFDASNCWIELSYILWGTSWYDLVKEGSSSKDRKKTSSLYTYCAVHIVRSLTFCCCSSLRLWLSSWAGQYWTRTLTTRWTSLRIKRTLPRTWCSTMLNVGMMKFKTSWSVLHLFFILTFNSLWTFEYSVKLFQKFQCAPETVKHPAHKKLHV